jgi:hypothetical protein
VNVNGGDAAGDRMSDAPTDARLGAVFIVEWQAMHGAARCAPSSAKENRECAWASMVDGRNARVS